jgi:DNA gyrase subunit A
MGRATSGVTGMKFRSDVDSVLSMSVIRAEQVAAEEAAEAKAEATGESTAAGELPDVKEQYVFTITDGGFAKRSRISEYRVTNRGGLGIKAMALANEDRGQLVGAFIVEEGDEIMSITQSGQVVRSPINADFRPTGRSTMGVKFVGPKSGDSVAVVARSVESREDEEGEVEGDAEGGLNGGESSDAGVGATIEGTVSETASDATDAAAPETDGESEA